jgi:hypothetical protein
MRCTQSQSKSVSNVRIVVAFGSVFCDGFVFCAFKTGFGDVYDVEAFFL